MTVRGPQIESTDRAPTHTQTGRSSRSGHVRAANRQKQPTATPEPCLCRACHTTYPDIRAYDHHLKECTP